MDLSDVLTYGLIPLLLLIIPYIFEYSKSTHNKRNLVNRHKWIYSLNTSIAVDDCLYNLTRIEGSHKRFKLISLMVSSLFAVFIVGIAFMLPTQYYNLPYIPILFYNIPLLTLILYFILDWRLEVFLKKKTVIKHALLFLNSITTVSLFVLISHIFYSIAIILVYTKYILARYNLTAVIIYYSVSIFLSIYPFLAIKKLKNTYLQILRRCLDYKYKARYPFVEVTTKYNWIYGKLSEILNEDCMILHNHSNNEILVKWDDISDIKLIEINKVDDNNSYFI